MRSIVKKQNGITLIALVVTIIVLIILAGVSIAMLVGENGIITQAQRAAQETEQAAKDEQQALASAFERNYVTYNGQLHVKGAKLMNEHNEEVRLTGMHGHGKGYWANFSYETFKSLKEKWNNNVFRIIVNYEEYSENKSDYLEQLYRLIDDVVDLDMYFIICWGGSSENPILEEAEEFFTTITQKYKDIPNIIYEIWNEPGVIWEEICNYSNTIIPLIRNINDRALILVGTPTSAAGVAYGISVVYQNELEYENIMYTDHLYNYGESTNQGFAREISRAYLKGIPIFISEWGITNGSGQGSVYEDVANEWLKLMDKYNLSWINHVLANSSIEGCSIFLPGKWSEELDENLLSLAGKYISNVFRNRNDYDYVENDYTMVLSSMQSGGYFWEEEYRKNITNIIFRNKIEEIPKNYIDIWDISKTGQGKVIAYLINDSEQDGKYILYIVTDGEEIFAESGSKGSVFRDFSSLETIDLTCFNTSKMTGMYAWFYGNPNLINIIGLDKLNVENVTNMQSIFAYCNSIESLNLTNFKFSELENYADMFYGINEQTQIYVEDIEDAKFVEERMKEVYKEGVIAIYYGSEGNWTQYEV